MGLSRPKDERVFPTAFDQINELTELRAELPWLADVPRNVCSQLLVELDKAWQRCFKRLGKRPRWKRKGLDSLGLCEPHPKAWRLDGNIVRFPKLGSIRAVVHRPLEGKPKTCTVKRDGDQWFVSIVCLVEVEAPQPKTEPVIAIDRGVTNVIADSDGLLLNPHASTARLSRGLLALNRQSLEERKDRRTGRKRSLVLPTCTARSEGNESTTVTNSATTTPRATARS